MQFFKHSSKRLIKSLPCSASGANLIHKAYFEHMLKNWNGDKNVLRLFSIVIFAIEFDYDVKWTLKVVPVGQKKRLLRPNNDYKIAISDFLTCLATFLVVWHYWNPHQKLLHVQIDHQPDFWPDWTCESIKSLVKQISPSVGPANKKK